MSDSDHLTEADRAVPSATYRVQVRPDFPLPATAELADYLADLGVSHLYTAPLLAAVEDSPHGYDVVDHTQVNPQVGGDDGWQTLTGALACCPLHRVTLARAAMNALVSVTEKLSDPVPLATRVYSLPATLAPAVPLSCAVNPLTSAGTVVLLEAKITTSRKSPDAMLAGMVGVNVSLPPSPGWLL